MTQPNQPNLFDLLPDVRRAFARAASKMRVLSAEKYHGRIPVDSAFLACTTALAEAATAAETLTSHTQGMNDALISPECMAELARETIGNMASMDWYQIDTRADELGRGVWLDEIEEWGKGVEEAA